MKLSGSILFLLAFGATQTNAFVSQTPAFARGASLASSRTDGAASSYEQAMAGYSNAPGRSSKPGGDSYTVRGQNVNATICCPTSIHFFSHVLIAPFLHILLLV